MKLQRKIKGLILIIRPELPLAAGMCVVLGELLALGGLPDQKTFLLGFALGFFLSSSAMVFNDYFDLEVDRVNAPHRPLPAGLLTGSEAIAAGIIMGLISLAIGWAFAPLIAILVLVAWLLGFLYNWKLKAAGIWGNLIVGMNVALTFIFGGIAVGNPWNGFVWAFGLIVFCFDLAEEIAGDAMDVAGDRKRGSQSIAIRWGQQAALRVSTGLFGLVILLTFLPIVLGERSLTYFLPITVTDLFIVFFVIRLLNSHTHAEGHASMRGLYITASLGLLAFLIGRFLG